MFSIAKVQLNLRRAAASVHIPLLKGTTVMSPAKVLSEHTKLRGRKVAILFEDRQITYGEFDQQATRYAKAAARLGLKKGDVVAVLMDNRPEFLYTVYGLNRLGITAALINTNLTGIPLTHILGAGELKALFVGAECLGHIEGLGKELKIPAEMILVECSEKPDQVLPKGARSLVPYADEAGDVLSGIALNAAKGDDWLCYIYTSGTTGLPKAGRFPNVRWFAGGYAIGGSALGCGSDDVIYVCLPLYHASAFVLGVSFALLYGGQLALARKFSASRFWDDVRKHEATVFVYIGEVCRYMVAQPAKPDDKMHQLRAIAGNGMRADVWREFVTRFGVDSVHEFYAATEGNANMVNLDGTVGAVGQLNLLTRLVYNTILVKWDPVTEEPIRDAKGFCIQCDVDEPGEMLGKIDPNKVQTRFDGYADPKATEKKILKDVLENGDRYFRTGDLLRRDKKGYYYFVDRIGDTFRWKGENVSTNEVADVLTLHPQVEVANVYGVQVGNADGRAGMATLNVAPGVTEIDVRSFYEHVRKNLPEYAQPLFLRVQPQAEMTGTFKLKKVDLQKEGFNPQLVKDPLYFKDPRAETYVPVDHDLYEQIQSQTLRV